MCCVVLCCVVLCCVVVAVLLCFGCCAAVFVCAAVLACFAPDLNFLHFRRCLHVGINIQF